METLGSLPSSKKFTTRPYHDPDQSSPSPILVLEGIFLILFSNLRLCHPSGFFPSGFLIVRATCLDHLILLDLIIRIIFGDQYRLTSSSLCSILKSPVKLTRLVIFELINLYWLWSCKEILSPSNCHFSLALKQNLGAANISMTWRLKQLWHDIW